MKNYTQFIQEFHESNPIEIDFVNNNLAKHLKENTENQNEIEKILDYLYSNKPDISKIGYKTILEKTEKWHKKLQSLSSKNDEKEWEDYDTILDFKDGFRFVQLKSQSAYNREWKLMSHCVASYYGRDVKIYSLRDSNNAPHCTIEKNQQIKWKWNGHIDPKYVDYVVKFLEKLWMSVWENEMNNLGYYKLENIDQNLSCEKTYNWYVYENNIDYIKDSEWNKYEWFGLLKIKKLVELTADFSLKWNFEISSMTNFVLRKKTKITAVANEGYSTAVARWSSSIAVANENYSTAVANESYSTAVANGKNSIAIIRSYHSKAKWTNWAWIVLTEWGKEEENIIDIQAKKVDWVEIKEDTFYKLEWGRFVEVI